MLNFSLNMKSMRPVCVPDQLVTETFEDALEAAREAIAVIEANDLRIILDRIRENKGHIDQALIGVTPANDGDCLFLGRMADNGNKHIPHTGILLDLSKEPSIEDFLLWLMDSSLSINQRLDLLTEIIAVALYRKRPSHRQGVAFISDESGNKTHLIAGLWTTGYAGHLRPHESAVCHHVPTKFKRTITPTDAAHIATNEPPEEGFDLDHILYRFTLHPKPSPPKKKKKKKQPGKTPKKTTITSRLEKAAADVTISRNLLPRSRRNK